ncbi:hypothetical protein CERSUDRAFT_74234 [Gelatoporia subvermispora B]|uniref:Uncharacterized protein n=1 Tax=Ceriporiopsis subvermispora (strain B) TaxID=914234 RepID=M2RBM7_CERS8|nr:hypothetical protein CERSUDRAFT_74234 [Gelatoporia subvermispora B]
MDSKILHVAMGKMLMRAQNNTYMALSVHLNTTEINCATLERERDTYRCSYEKLLETLKSSNDGPWESQKYWHVRSWQQRDKFEEVLLDVTESRQRGKSCAAQNINVAMRYVESAEARSIWSEWKHDGKLELKWSRVTPKDVAYYRMSMESTFPELKLCSHHWEVDKIGKQVYPNFIIKDANNEVEKCKGRQAKSGSGNGDRDADVENAAIRTTRVAFEKCHGTDEDSTAPSKKQRTDAQPDNEEICHQGDSRWNNAGEPMLGRMSVR